MSTVGQPERKTQDRIVQLFVATLGYEYLGNWIDQPRTSNVEPDILSAWLRSRGVAPELAAKAIYALTRAADDTSKSLYDRNRAVYDLLRYGVSVKPGAGEATETVWLIDWDDPWANRFAVAEEVTVAAPNPKAHEKRPDIVLYVNGIALAVLELKRSTVSVGEGIRQNIQQPAEGLHRALLLDPPVGHGRQRHRGPPLRHHRDEGEALPLLVRGGRHRKPPRPRARADLPQDPLPPPRARLRRLRRGGEEGLPPQPVLRRGGCGAARARPRGRHHLAHAGLGEEPDHGLARQLDPRERARSPRPRRHRPDGAGRPD